MKNQLIITIDGTAGSGKSTTARIIAERLGYVYIDTGAMYRAIALEAREKKIDWGDRKKVAKIAISSRIEFKDSRVFINRRDVSEKIRTLRIGEGASIISTYPEVRKRLVSLQREIGKKGGVVIEGRDTGTVVFPDADIKIYMDASQEERAKRIKSDIGRINFNLVKKELSERDERDMKRKQSPLIQAKDAFFIDTTNLSVNEQVEAVIELVKSKLKNREI